MYYTFLKNQKSFQLLCIGLLILTMFLTACNNKPENMLVGKWQNIEGKLSTIKSFTFYKDGTVVKDGSSGTYRILEKGLLEFNFPSASCWKGLVLSFTVSDNEFILKWPDLIYVYKYKRID
jgi:hypothetical protein